LQRTTRRTMRALITTRWMMRPLRLAVRRHCLRRILRMLRAISQTRDRWPMSKDDKQHVCRCHPDRIAATSRAGVPLCWQCSLSPAKFERRLGADFYTKPNSPGRVAPAAPGKGKACPERSRGVKRKKHALSKAEGAKVKKQKTESGIQEVKRGLFE